MILKHDIPQGAKLYFGKEAKIKREIENIAAEVFETLEFEEIVTPFFSYHQLEALDEKELIRFTDEKNRSLALRGDSSIDVVRLVIKRLRSAAKKWFYIQPVFRAPSSEMYQIGAEWLEGNLVDILKANNLIFERLNKSYTLQLSHIKIPQKVAEITGLEIEDIKKMRLYKFEDEWLKKLVSIHMADDLDNLDMFPDEIAMYLNELKEVAKHFENAIIAPLYVANLRYYTGVFYRVLKDNTVYAKGGEYVVEGERSVGFSIYTDNLLKDING